MDLLKELTGIPKKNEAIADLKVRVYYRGAIPTKKNQTAIPKHMTLKNLLSVSCRDFVSFFSLLEKTDILVCVQFHHNEKKSQTKQTNRKKTNSKSLTFFRTQSYTRDGPDYCRIPY